VEHPDGRGDDEEGEHEQHAGKRHGARDHETEGGVEREVAKPAGQLEPRMQQAHGGVQAGGPCELGPADRQDVPGEDLADVLGALRGAIDDQQCRGGGHDIDDADLRFLGNARRPGPRRGEHGGRAQREGERIGVSRGALGKMAEDERGGCTQRRHLRERQVDEDHVAPEHVQPEIRVDGDERRAREGGQGEELDHFTAASVRTL
jgi:hypothetical protein